jgi:hypothetical protein
VFAARVTGPNCFSSVVGSCEFEERAFKGLEASSWDGFLAYNKENGRGGDLGMAARATQPTLRHTLSRLLSYLNSVTIIPREAAGPVTEANVLRLPLCGPKLKCVPY